MRNQAKRKKQYQMTHGDGKSIIKLDHPTPESIAESLRPKIKLVPFIEVKPEEQAASPTKTKKSVKQTKFKDEAKLNSIEEEQEESIEEEKSFTA